MDTALPEAPGINQPGKRDKIFFARKNSATASMIYFRKHLCTGDTLAHTFSAVI